MDDVSIITLKPGVLIQRPVVYENLSSPTGRHFLSLMIARQDGEEIEYKYRYLVIYINLCS